MRFLEFGVEFLTAKFDLDSAETLGTDSTLNSTNLNEISTVWCGISYRRLDLDSAEGLGTNPTPNSRNLNEIS